jgi:hypothetical protein
MPSNNLTLFIINRGKRVLLVKQTSKNALWTLPGGHIVLKDGFTRAAYQCLRPYFRDLTVMKVKYLRTPVEDISFSDAHWRLIPIGCDIRGTIKKKMRQHIWFVKSEDLVNHVVVPGTIELLSLPEIQSRLS